MRLTSSLVSGPGAVRDLNQDNFYLNGLYNSSITLETQLTVKQWAGDNEGLFAVADGMGGEKHGELAALITVSSLDQLDRGRGAEGAIDYLNDRNRDICALIQQNGGARSGSTFVGLNIHGGMAEIVNIGDSRAYLLRKGALSQLSVDHTAIRPMVEIGILSAEKARRHPDRHKLSQHLGIFPEEMLIEPYFAACALRDGDLFLLCSDGLYDMLEDSAILHILQSQRDLKQAAVSLYDAAMAEGGKDNTTVLLVHVQAAREERG